MTVFGQNNSLDPLFSMLDDPWYEDGQLMPSGGADRAPEDERDDHERLVAGERQQKKKNWEKERRRATI